MSIKVFFSYSHKDERYKAALETHLAILRKQGKIEIWDDRKIMPGDDWEEDINLNIRNAKIILLLISPDFLASDYCYETETIFALEQHEKGASVVIPVILKPCLWKESVFKHLQVRPKDGKPVIKWRIKEDAWQDVSEGILEVIEEINSKPSTSPKAEEQVNLVYKGLGAGLGALVRLPLGYRYPLEHTSSGKVFNTIAYADESLRDTLLRFLSSYKSFYFSPLRIQKWGSKQNTFGKLRIYEVADIKKELGELLSLKRLKTTTSKKGNTLYKFIS